MKHLRALLMVLFVLLIIIVAVQNYKPMSETVQLQLDLIFFQHVTPKMSMYLITIMAFLIGILFAGLYGIAERFRLKAKVKALINEARERDHELNSLRNLPVTTEDVSESRTAEEDESM